MNRNYLKQIIIDQKDSYLENEIIKREYELETNVNYCFVGIRRTGKSYMLFQQIQDLLSKNISINQIAYVNFEDERLLEITSDDLNVILEICMEMAGPYSKPYLFLDEIQNVDGWENFVRRLSDLKYRINITGSNSKMLSREIASTLGGRFLIKSIYPYSFKEYLKAKNIEVLDREHISTKQRAIIIAQYEDYIQFGAFPELVEIKNKREYLNSIYQTVYIGDILTRNRISNDFSVRLILKKLAESVTKAISYNRLTNIVKSTGMAIGKQTVINYVGYMIDSYLLFKIQNYHSKLVDKESISKYYFMDTGLLGLLLIDKTTAQLENLVAIELVRRYGVENVYYFENNIEIDFYIPEDNLAIQVCFDLSNNIETKERETKAFIKMKQFLENTKYIIITHSEECKIELKGIDIEVIPIWKWLLEK